MTSTKDRPLLTEPLRRTEPPKRKVPPRRVRWIAWAASMVIIGAGVLVAVLMMRSDSEPFAEIYEAESPLSYGAVHEPGFDVGFRWGGESDGMLEEFEARFDTFESLYEAESVLSYGAVHEGIAVEPRFAGEAGPTLEEFEAGIALQGLEASVGEADRVFDRYLNPEGILVISLEDLAALQASTGEADRVFDRYVEEYLADLQASVGAADWRFIGPPTG